MKSTLEINPGSNCLEIQFTSPASFMKVFDSSGKLLKQSRLNKVATHYFPGNPGKYLIETDAQVKHSKSFDDQSLRNQKSYVQFNYSEGDEAMEFRINGVLTDSEKIKLMLDKKEFTLKEFKSSVIRFAYHSIEKTRRNIILSKDQNIDVAQLNKLDKELSNLMDDIKKAKNMESLLKVNIKIPQ